MPRKTAYSGKQKKQQLKETRTRKQDGPKYITTWCEDENEDSCPNPDSESKILTTQEAAMATTARGKLAPSKRAVTEFNVRRINEQPQSRSNGPVNHFQLHFLKEPDDVVEKRKREAQRPYRRKKETELECSLQAMYPPHAYLDFPKRPAWGYDHSKEKLDGQERSYFQNFLSELMSQPRACDLSYFDLNLENWRQLWRVLEISNVLLIIADIRYPVLHISPSLVNYVQTVLHKPVIIVLNKIDFVPSVLAIAWKRYLQQQFPDVSIVFFSSFVKELTGDQKGEDALPLDFDPSKVIFQKKKKVSSTSCLGPSDLYQAVLDIVKDKVDLSEWRQKLEEEGFLFSPSSLDNSHGNGTTLPEHSNSTSSSALDHRNDIPSGSEEPQEDNTIPCCNKGDGGDDDVDAATSDEKEEKTLPTTPQPPSPTVGHNNDLFKDGVVTIGCIGYPNVGKSSVLNALKGKKVVSISQTPGHTKHLQTIFLSPNVQLCDCPGLVFPSMVPKALQVVAGIFPVAQVKEPYSSVQYLAEHINLPVLLKIRPPEHANLGEYSDEEEYYRWTANDICEAFAVKQGFYTSKAARPDIYRAANKLLRLAVEGRLCLCLRPPNYSDNRDALISDTETQTLHTNLFRAGSSRKTPSHYLKEEDEEEEEESD